MNWQALGMLAAVAPAAARQAVALEELILAGQRVGLTDEQAREVLDAWIGHYRTTPWPLPIERVSLAMSVRAMAGSWQPPVMVLDGRMI